MIKDTEVWKDKTVMPLSAARGEHISEDPFIPCAGVPWISFGKAAIWHRRLWHPAPCPPAQISPLS